MGVCGSGVHRVKPRLLWKLEMLHSGALRKSQSTKNARKKPLMHCKLRWARCSVCVAAPDVSCAPHLSLDACIVTQHDALTAKHGATVQRLKAATARATAVGAERIELEDELESLSKRVRMLTVCMQRCSAALLLHRAQHCLTSCIHPVGAPRADEGAHGSPDQAPGIRGAP